MSDDDTKSSSGDQKEKISKAPSDGQSLRERNSDVAGKQTGQEQNPPKQSKPKWWQFSSQGVFNFLIVVIYAYQAHIMSGQLDVMNNQLAEMRSSSADTKAIADAAEKQSAAAKTTAEAAQQSAKVAEQTLVLSQRPWVAAYLY